MKRSRGLWPATPALVVFACFPALSVGQTASGDLISQVDHFGNGAPLLANSAFGQYSADVLGGTSIGYLNVWASNPSGGTWAVQNLPILPSSFAPSTVPVTTAFDLTPLGISPGTPLAGINFNRTITPAPLLSPPVASGVFQSFIPHFNHDAEGRDDLGGPHTSPGAAPSTASLNFSFPLGKFHWNNNVPNVETGRNECGPAAATNSLEWLRTTQGVNVPNDGMPNRLNTLKDAQHMQTHPVNGTKDGNFIRGKMKYISDNGIGIHMKFMDDQLGGANITQNGYTAEAKGLIPTWDFISSEINHGEDVEIGFTYLNAAGQANGGHWITAVGKIDLFGAQGIWFVEDTKQGAAGGTDKIGFSWLTTGANGFLKLANYAGGNNMIDIVVSESVPAPGVVVTLGLGGLIAARRRRA